MKIINSQNNKVKRIQGFTLVETMFAVVILTFTIVALMTVVASSLFASRYARDEITVNYLLQEVIDQIRNDRDTTVFLSQDGTWDMFYAKYSGNCSDSTTGCYFDILTAGTNINGVYTNIPTINKCNSGGCPYLYYDPDASSSSYYVNDNGGGMLGMTKTNFKRKIVITNPTIDGKNDEIDVTVTITWINGGMALTRSLSTSFLKWQQ